MTNRMLANEWAMMPLMKSFTYIDSATCEVMCTEVRRDEATGLTLKHTYQVFPDTAEVTFPNHVRVEPYDHKKHDKGVQHYDMHSDLLTGTPSITMSDAIGVGAIGLALILGAVAYLY